MSTPRAQGEGLSRPAAELHREGNASVPFNILDQWIVHLDQEPEPWSVHLEVRVAGRLDSDRLAAAILAASTKHPMARARRAPFHKRDRRHVWEVGARIDHLALEIVDCPDEEALAEARDRLESLHVSLDASPPFAVTLAHRPGGDSLLMNLHHAAIDGIGAYRLLTSIARAYAGEDDPVPALDPLAARDLRRHAGVRSIGELTARARLLRDRVAEMRSEGRPARLATAGGTEHVAGYRFHLLRIGREETELIMARRVRPATVNDLLVAALAIAIEEFNSARGLPTRRVSIMMPVNMRPEAWSGEVAANILSFVSVSVLAPERSDLATAQLAVQARTRELKGRPMSGLMIDVAGLSGFWPLGFRHFLARTLRGLVSDAVVDTTILSTLGRLEPPLDFGPEAGLASEIWFSPPAQMPLGASIGVATMGDEIFATVRYRPHQYDAEGAGALAEAWHQALLGS